MRQASDGGGARRVAPKQVKVGGVTKNVGQRVKASKSTYTHESGDGRGMAKAIKSTRNTSVTRGHSGSAPRKVVQHPRHDGFDAGKFVGDAVDNFGRGVGVVGKGIGDFIGGIPGAISGGRDALMGGTPGIVNQAMNKK